MNCHVACPPPTNTELFNRSPHLLSQQGVQNSVSAPSIQRRTVQPAADIIETDADIKIVLDLPGVSPDTLNIEVSNNTLTISGNPINHFPEHAVLRHREYAIVNYQRSFSLSTRVNHDKIEAKMKFGVATITIPKEQPVIRKIPVTE